MPPVVAGSSPVSLRRPAPERPRASVQCFVKPIYAIRDKARKIEARMKADYDRAKKAADRKHGVSTKEKAADRSSSRCAELENQIAELPAQGIVGVAIKLGVAKHNEDFLSEPCDALVLSASRAHVVIANKI